MRPDLRAATGLLPAQTISQKELAKLSAEWPVGRFIEVWNGFQELRSGAEALTYAMKLSVFRIQSKFRSLR